MKKIFTLLAFTISFYASSKPDADDHQVIGSWVGHISIFTEQKSQINVTFFESSNGELQKNYTYWGNQVEAEPHQPKNNLKSAKNKFQFSLEEFGFTFTGHLINRNTISGKADFMGLSHDITFQRKTKQTKLTSPKDEQSPKMNVAVLVFDGVDTLDWAGPLEVFDYAIDFNTYTVSATTKPIRNGAYNVIANYTFDDMPKPDILVIPGGNVSHLFKHQKAINWLKQNAQISEHVLSVCNASTWLAANELLDDLSATTHYWWVDWLERLSGKYNFNVESNVRFVDNGKIITTAGVSSGIDGALHLVAKLKGEEHAKRTAKYMEYRWTPEVKYKAE